MRRFLLIAVLFAASLGALSQGTGIDLSLSNNYFSSTTGGEIDANQIGTAQVVRINVTVGNFVSGVAAPAGHFRIRIGLGNGLILNPTFNLATAPLSNYFNWSYDLSGSQPQIVGNSIAPLPVDFAEPAYFDLRAVNSTTSTVSFNFLIANPPGTPTPIFDPASANNSCANTYSVVAGGPLPVTLSHFNAVRKDCEVRLAWKAETQVNLKHYEVEVSKDNNTFAKQGELTGRADGNYAHAFPLTDAVKAPVLYVRLKSVELDGSFHYSKTVPVSGQCTAKWVLALFPNPVRDLSIVTVQAREGIFDGKYKVSVISAAGQLIKQQEMKLAGVKTFPLSVAGISAGKYHVQIESTDGSARDVLEFEKL